MTCHRNAIKWRRIGAGMLAFGVTIGAVQAQVDLENLARQLENESDIVAPFDQSGGAKDDTPSVSRVPSAKEVPLVSADTDWRFPQSPEELSAFARQVMQGRETDPRERMRRICKLVKEMQAVKPSSQASVNLDLCRGVGGDLQ